MEYAVKHVSESNWILSMRCHAHYNKNVTCKHEILIKEHKNGKSRSF